MRKKETKNKEIKIPQYLYDEIIEIELQGDTIREALKLVKHKRPFNLLMKQLKEYKKKKEAWWKSIRLAADFSGKKKLRYDLGLKTVREIDN